MELKLGQHPQSDAWRGRHRHTSRNTQAWLQRAKEQTGSWPKNGLSDHAIVKLVNALPTLARNTPELFEASVKLLMAQNDDPAWQGSLNRRLAVIRRAVQDKRPGFRGDALAFMVRNDSWIGIKDENCGQWTIHDGRSLDKFIQHGGHGRKFLWSALTKIPALTRVEIPAKHLGYEAWAAGVLKITQFLESDHPKVQQALQSGRTWKLAVRRIKRLGLRGLFDPDTQTVIVDPRHPGTLLHELGHWVLNHNQHTDPLKAEKQVHALLESGLSMAENQDWNRT